MAVVARVEEGGFETEVGYREVRGQRKVWAGTREGVRREELVGAVPLVFVGTDQEGIVDGGPEVRRRLLDWGVFHVEPGFLGHWRRYARALRQRNAQLREGGPSGLNLSVWEREMAEAAGPIDRARAAYAAQLIGEVGALLAELGPQLPPVSLSFRPGWASGEWGLEGVLAQERETDRRLGFTGSGPHRADMAVGVSGRRGARFLSRGQKRLVAIATALAQTRILLRHTSRSPVVLLDDLAAELDRDTQGTILDHLTGSGCQSFLTTTDPALADMAEADLDRWFHVEHGEITPML
jgi:DNA replication and repair protein RecF